MTDYEWKTGDTIAICLAAIMAIGLIVDIATSVSGY